MVVGGEKTKPIKAKQSQFWEPESLNVRGKADILLSIRLNGAVEQKLYGKAWIGEMIMIEPKIIQPKTISRRTFCRSAIAAAAAMNFAGQSLRPVISACGPTSSRRWSTQ